MAILQEPPVSMSSLFWDLSSEPIPPPGTYLATCIDVVDKFGVSRPKYEDRNQTEKVDLTAFLFGLRDQAGTPFRIATRSMRISIKDNSNLYGFLRSWLGRAPVVGWDYVEMKGKKALLTVDHETRRDGTKYATIVTVSPVPAGYTQPAPAPAAPSPLPAPAAPSPVNVAPPPAAPAPAPASQPQAADLGPGEDKIPF